MAQELKTLQEYHVRFCSEYLVDFDPVAAILRSGWTKEVDKAKNIAYKWMKQNLILDKIKELNQEYCKKTEATRDNVLKELGIIAFCNAYKLRKKVMVDSLSEDEQRVVKSVLITRRTNGDIKFKVEAFDKLRALEMLCRSLGMFTDNFNHNLKASHEDIMKLIDDLEKEPRVANEAT